MKYLTYPSPIVHSFIERRVFCFFCSVPLLFQHHQVCSDASTWQLNAACIGNIPLETLQTFLPVGCEFYCFFRLPTTAVMTRHQMSAVQQTDALPPSALLLEIREESNNRPSKWRKNGPNLHVWRLLLFILGSGEWGTVPK